MAALRFQTGEGGHPWPPFGASALSSSDELQLKARGPGVLPAYAF